MGSTVTITVGEGPADTETGSAADVSASSAPEKAPVPKQQTQVPEWTPVPNVVGRNVEKAKQTIQNARFAYAVETIQSNQPIGNGRDD